MSEAAIDFTDFVPVDSQLSGIEVFAPKPPEEKHEKVVAFSCLQCGGTKAFSAENGTLTCTQCGHFEQTTQTIVGTEAQELEFKVDTLERSSEGWGTERTELTCDNCGGRTSLPPTLLTDSCPFCHSQRVHQHQAPQDELRPGFLIPLSLKPKEAQSRLLNWVGTHWMLADGLKDAVARADIQPIFLPFFTIDSHAYANWKAEVGHTRMTKDGAKTDWRWESGREARFFDDWLISGTEHVDTHLSDQVKPFDLEAMVPYEASYLAGIAAQGQEIPLDEAWATGRKRMRERMKQLCYQAIDSSNVRNFQMKLKFADESWRYVLLPFYLASYSFEGKNFQVLLNGQTGKAAGKKPVNWPKIWRIIGICMFPGTFLSILGLTLGKIGQVDIGAIGIAGLVLGGIVSYYLYSTGKQLESA